MHGKGPPGIVLLQEWLEEKGERLVWFLLFFFLFCFSELRIEPRALLLLGKHSTTELNPQP